MGRITSSWLGIVSALALAIAPRPAPALVTKYLYSLSNFTGTIPFSAVALSWDPAHNELYVIGDGRIRVFNDAGMEIYAFGDSEGIGSPISVAPLPEGDLLVLAYSAGKPTVFRCDYRGRPLGKWELINPPVDFVGDFSPGVIRYADDKVYLAALGQMKVLVASTRGEVIAYHDVAALLERADERGDLGLAAFNVDRDGNMLFTIQPLFAAYVMSVDGKLRPFGTKGSAPGKFNVVAGIAADDQGNLYVTDLLKSAVIVFNPQLRFLREFGYRGRRPESLFAPVEVVAGNGKLFVAQNARKGVSVFQIEN